MITPADRFWYCHTLTCIGQMWEHKPDQRVAASTLRRYSFGLRLAIAQVDARPTMPISFRWAST